MTRFEMEWEKVAPHISDDMSDEILQQLEPLEIDSTDKNPNCRRESSKDYREEYPNCITLSTDYRDGIALFAVKQTSLEGYCAKAGSNTQATLTINGVKYNKPL